MGLLSAFKRSSSRDSSQAGAQRQSDERPASSDKNAEPTPLRPLKLSLTPAKPRRSSSFSDGLQGRDKRPAVSSSAVQHSPQSQSCARDCHLTAPCPPAICNKAVVVKPRTRSTWNTGLLQEASLRQKHGASPSPARGVATTFRQARSRFETRSDGSTLSRPGSAAVSAAASPQQAPRTPGGSHHQAQPSYEAYSPLLLGPPASRSVQWTAHPSPVRWVTP